jgi:hypothetical protein
MAVTAGFFLLAKTKLNELGKFYKVISWLIIGCGVLLIVGAVQFAAFKVISQRGSTPPAQQNCNCPKEKDKKWNNNGLTDFIKDVKSFNIVRDDEGNITIRIGKEEVKDTIVKNK